MADALIHQIENSAKIEALIGMGIIALVGLMSEKIYTGEQIPVEIFWGLGILGVFYFGLQLMAYLKFYIQKMVYLKEQEVLTKVQTLTLDKEITKLGLVRDIKALEAGAVDG